MTAARLTSKILTIECDVEPLIQSVGCVASGAGFQPYVKEETTAQQGASEEWRQDGQSSQTIQGSCSVQTDPGQEI